MIGVWNKEKIRNLDQIDIEQWFDVLNNGLVEDRGYSLTNSKIDDIKSTIKMDYINYLKSCPLNSRFHSYYVLRNHYTSSIQFHKKNGFIIIGTDEKIQSLF